MAPLGDILTYLSPPVLDSVDCTIRCIDNSNAMNIVEFQRGSVFTL